MEPPSKSAGGARRIREEEDEEEHTQPQGPIQFAKKFLETSPEKPKLNQYWYSASTAATLVAAIEEQVAATDQEQEHEASQTGRGPALAREGLAVAFLSTPSLFFSVSPAVRARSRLLDLDEQLASSDPKLASSDPNFVCYDFNHPEALPVSLHGRFAMVVMDPPFITREVWELYARAARMLLRDGIREGIQPPRILATTVQENAALMAELFGAREQHFKPMVPNLVYQFSLFTTFESPRLAFPNTEVAEDA